ncbi:MAG: DnaB-like helicase C-terminal domain-containing protein [Ferrovibrio sp.]|uniref:DnaB-like helicase C-terminal domain-containing protein n=1 Tax=Ferrovibrio sp. TaxID=1917215 RepID=UPI00391CF222
MGESNFVQHEPCPACGSKDNLARYDDGHAVCFSHGCDYYERGDGEASIKKSEKRVKGLIEPGETRALSKRGINEETCRKWSYTVGKYKGKSCQIANYRDASGQIVAQKVRFPNKDFLFLGDSDAGGLYGQHLWRDGGKMLVVTEGEIDALTVSQLQGNKWPVVSIPTGSKGAKKAIAKQLEWLLKFDTVVFMFDMDDPGREAAEECAAVLPPGRAKIASLPLKDPNDCLLAGKGKEVIDAIWGAKDFRPDGLVTIADLKDEVLKPVEWGLPWVFETLTKHTYGRRLGECYAVGAGTGIGKTDFLTQQIAYDLDVLNEPVGLFFLEQQPVETGKRIAGKLAKKLFHIPDEGWTTEDLQGAWDRLSTKKLFLYDHFGAADWEGIRDRIRYLAHAHGVRIFYLDHLTALAAGADGESEKEALERIMEEIGRLVKELNIILIFVSHLSTPEGKPHEEGGRVMIRHFKGSRSIGFWSHFMFGLERNQQDDDEKMRTITTFRILKDRYTGRATGEVFYLGYERATGILFETELPEEDKGFPPADEDEEGF